MIKLTVVQNAGMIGNRAPVIAIGSRAADKLSPSVSAGNGRRI